MRGALIHRGRVRIALVVNPGAGGRPDADRLVAAMAPAEAVRVALGEIEDGIEAGRRAPDGGLERVTARAGAFRLIVEEPRR